MSHTTTAPATAPEAVRRHRLLIDGRWVDPVEGGTVDTVDPSTGTKLAELAAGGPRDVDLAVQAARRFSAVSSGLGRLGLVRSYAAARAYAGAGSATVGRGSLAAVR